MSNVPLRGSIRLPKGWRSQVRSAVVRAISLAKFSVTQVYGRAAIAANPRRRLEARRIRHSIAGRLTPGPPDTEIMQCPTPKATD